MGPGVMPWPDEIAEQESAIVPNYKTLHEEKLPRCGDGFGRIGTNDSWLPCLGVQCAPICSVVVADSMLWLPPQAWLSRATQLVLSSFYASWMCCECRKPRD
jgi:hypothetical protein